MRDQPNQRAGTSPEQVMTAAGDLAVLPGGSVRRKSLADSSSAEV